MNRNGRGRFIARGLAAALLCASGCDLRRADNGSEGAPDAAAPAVKSEAVQVVSRLRSRFDGAATTTSVHPLGSDRASKIDPLAMAQAAASAPAPALPAGLALRFDVSGDRLSPVFAEPAIGSAPMRRAAVSLPSSASGAFSLRDLESGMTIEAALVGATDAGADAAGGYVLYRSALEGADLLHRPTPEGTEDDLAFERAPGRPEVSYRVSLASGVAGLRLISDTVEFIDADGTPRLRMNPPILVGADRKRTFAAVTVEGCAVDRNPVGPWGRVPVAPGAPLCTIRVAWNDRAIAYPALLDPQWVTVGSMAAARTGHTLTTLVGGKVLAAGYVNSSELFDPKTNTWATTGPIRWLRANHVAVLMNSGKVLIAGGAYQGGASAEVYDPGMGTWTVTTGSMQDARINAAATLLKDGRVMVSAGINNQSFSIASVDIFDPTTTLFGATNNLAISRNGHVMFTLPSGKVIVAGGSTGGANWTEQWDPATGLWTHIGTSSSRTNPVGALLPGPKILMAGGWDGGGGYPITAEVFDPNTMLWSATANNMSSPRYYGTGTFMQNGKLLLAAGTTNGNTVTATADVYDPATNTFTATASLNTARGQHAAAALLDGRTLVSGGGANNAALASAEVFSACLVNADCASNFCVDNFCCNAACAGGCDRCDLPNTQGICTVVTAGNAGTSPSCTPYLCDGVNGICPAGCNNDAGCIAADFCDLNTFTCKTKYTNGLACFGNNQCQTGFCADGFCCSSACSGNCDVCAKALGGSQDGVCTNITGPGSPMSCAPYLCTSSGPNCPTSCTADANCANTYKCVLSKCIQPQGLGAPCTVNGQCTSGACSDGVCCNAACLGGCDVCAAALGATMDGTCTVLGQGNGGQNPSCNTYICDGQNGVCPTTCANDMQCSATGYCSGGKCLARSINGANCTAADQCISNFCVDGVCCNSACSGGCDQCNVANAVGTCSVISKGNPGQNPSCLPYLCNGTSANCPTSCAQNTDCTFGDTCTNGACIGNLGAACTSGIQCASTFCADGYCCNAACTDQCAACNLLNKHGMCSPVTGAPVAPRPACTTDGTVCGGACDGTVTTACAYPGNATTCKAASCASGVGSLASTCDSGGHCPGPITINCAPYACGASACLMSCAKDADCVTGNYCNLGTGKCVIKGANGAACTASNQCQSSSCSDGVCCNAACSGGCDVCAAALGASMDGTCTVIGKGSAGSPSCTPYLCDGTNGVCPSSCKVDTDCTNGVLCVAGVCGGKLANGLACTQVAQCTSGNCVDGVCCNATCTGQCASCNLPNKAGTCSAVTGAPVGGRTACATDGSVCGGKCDGVNQAACAYAGNASTCVVATCNNGVQIARSGCDGAGKCPAAATSTCTPYICGASACKTACAVDGDCINGDYCNANKQCVPLLGPGASCTAANQCSTTYCADGVCCNAQCLGQCSSCNLPNKVGTCSAVTGPPSGNRPACTSDGTVCGGACDGANLVVCAYPTSATSCGAAPSCANGIATLAASCDAGRCSAATTSACSPYVCGGNACLTACMKDADCIGGYYCNAQGKCTGKLAIGFACSAGTQCQSTFCADGVCCNAACNGQCSSCNLANTVGACTAVSGAPVGGRSACGSDGGLCGGKCDGVNLAACAYPPNTTTCVTAACMNGVATAKSSCDGAGTCPAPVTTQCKPYACGATTCLASCNVDGDCAAGNFCNGNKQCVPKGGFGASCSATNQCLSGFCADGVCCNAACTGQCSSCNLANLAGTCSPVTGAPLGGRPPCVSDGTNCGGVCNGLNLVACTFPGNAASCRGASCVNGIATASASCDGAGHCPPAMSTPCAPFVCGNNACIAACMKDGDCVNGDYCNAQSQCVPKGGPGASCSAGSQCQSTFCADGVCCDQACAGQCMACNLANKGGTCSAVSGAPVGGRPACGSDGSLCGGSCNGVNPFACTYPGGNTSCRAASCANSVAIQGAVCDGKGACPAQITTACAPYLCGANACLTTCTKNGDCVLGDFCDMQGHCAGQAMQGQPCTAGNQCATGFCADGVCCDAACTGQCAACNVKNSVGTCSVVTGAPAMGHPACASDGTSCGGACDGMNPMACAYPGGNTGCRMPGCANGMAFPGAACDGKGACPAPVVTACAPFACGPSACLSMCATDADCAGGDYCNAQKQCVAKGGPGAMCAAKNQCATGFCADGVCCDSACTDQCAACNLMNRVGTCSIVLGAPVGPRSACAGSGMCQGVCDGKSAPGCAFPDQKIICAPPACMNGVARSASACDGAGLCAPGPNTQCNFGCDGAACLVPDMAMSPDLATPPDLAIAPDLATGDDLAGSTATDGASNPDLSRAGQTPDLATSSPDGATAAPAAGCNCSVGTSSGSRGANPAYAFVALAMLALVLRRRRR